MATKTALRVNASGRQTGSRSRALTSAIVDHLIVSGTVNRVIERDLATGVAFVDEDWIGANFTPEDERTTEQRQRLAGSDALVDELFAADIILIGMPIYNFGVPGTLKAWIDQVARVRKTFRYTADGPKGLIAGKTVYLVVTSGGTPIDGPIDFATGYMRHVLGFLGMTDVTVIVGDKLTDGEDPVIAAEAQIVRELGNGLVLKAA